MDFLYMNITALLFYQGGLHPPNPPRGSKGVNTCTKYASGGWDWIRGPKNLSFGVGCYLGDEAV